MPGKEEEGVNLFFNASVKTYLHMHKNSDNSAVRQLNECLTSNDIKLYLTDIRMPEHDAPGQYELIAFNKEGKSRCFLVECDKNLQIKSLSKIKLEAISPASKEYYEQIKSEAHGAEAAASAPKPH